MLTKSLHTITAVANVARYIESVRAPRDGTAETLTQRALAVLGYNIAEFAEGDETVARCIAAVRKMLAESDDAKPAANYSACGGMFARATRPAS